MQQIIVLGGGAAGLAAALGAAQTAPHSAAAASAASMTAALTKGRAASWMATSSPCAARTPFRALSARVAPPSAIRTGFAQPCACRITKSRFFPATRTISSTSGHCSNARMLRRSTVSPPRSKLSLSNPMRVEDPAATNTADMRFFNDPTCLRLLRFVPNKTKSRPLFLW